MAVHLVERLKKRVLVLASGLNHKEIVNPNTLLHDSITANRSRKDDDKAKFSLGQKVKLLKDIVNDGTYPHSSIGVIIIPKDSIGYIKDIGEFLQVIRVYEVHFLGVNAPVEIVGCREHELFALEYYQDEVEEEFEFLRKHREKYLDKK